MQTLVLKVRGRAEVRILKPGVRLIWNYSEPRTKVWLGGVIISEARDAEASK